MSLSEPGKTRQRRARHSVSSLHSMNSPPASPPPVNAKKVKGHERSQSDCSVTPPVSLSAESSSVTSLQSRIKNANHILIKGNFHLLFSKRFWRARKIQNVNKQLTKNLTKS